MHDPTAASVQARTTKAAAIATAQLPKAKVATTATVQSPMTKSVMAATVPAPTSKPATAATVQNPTAKAPPQDTTAATQPDESDHAAAKEGGSANGGRKKCSAGNDGTNRANGKESGNGAAETAKGADIHANWRHGGLHVTIKLNGVTESLPERVEDLLSKRADVRQASCIKELDMSANAISSVTVNRVLAVLQTHGLSPQTLKLYANNITSTEELTAMVRRPDGILRELHLSHNMLSTSEAKKLIVGCCTAVNSNAEPKYPLDHRPLWLRLEQNMLIDKTKLALAVDAELRQNGLNFTDVICETADQWGNSTARVSLPYMGLAALLRRSGNSPKPIATQQHATGGGGMPARRAPWYHQLPCS